MHDVLRVLAERARAGSQPGRRDDGFRVALAIEGGGMRGTISAGAVSRLATDGRLLRNAFESGRAATHAAFTP